MHLKYLFSCQGGKSTTESSHLFTHGVPGWEGASEARGNTWKLETGEQEAASLTFLWLPSPEN